MWKAITKLFESRSLTIVVGSLIFTVVWHFAFLGQRFRWHSQDNEHNSRSWLANGIGSRRPISSGNGSMEILLQLF